MKLLLVSTCVDLNENGPPVVRTSECLVPNQWSYLKGLSMGVGFEGSKVHSRPNLWFSLPSENKI